MRIIACLLATFNLNTLLAQCDLPSPKQAVAATVEGSQAAIKILDAKPNERYHIYRAQQGSNDFAEIAQTPFTQFSDVTIDPSSGSYCYYVKVENPCGNISSASPTSCTIHLTGKGKKIQWNAPFPNFPVDVSFKVCKVEAPPVDVSSWQTFLSFLLSSKAQTSDTYRVKANIAFQVDGQFFQTELYSSLYEIIELPAIYPPDVFTPNDDTINDTWTVQGRLIQSFSLKIFDRQGFVIFESDSLGKSWNGQLPNGTPAPVQVYTYLINVSDSFNEYWEQSGKLLLLR